MACATANVKFRLRRGNASEWTTRILLDGEPGFDTTNNILKIGNAGKTWDQLPRANFDLFGIPLAPTNLALTASTAVSKTFSWTYPLQTQTGFSSSKLPLITQFNAEITYTGGTLTLSDMPPDTRTLVLNMNTGTSSSSGTTYTYYNPIFQSVLVNPILRIWYSNYSTEPPNKASIPLDAFSLPKGYPSAVQNLNANLIRNRLIVTYSPPALNNSLVSGDSVALDKYRFQIGSNLPTSEGDNAPNITFFVYNVSTGQTGLTVTITPYNTYAAGDISSGTPAPFSVSAPTIIADHNTTIEETVESLTYDKTPYVYAAAGPATNDMFYYRGKFRTFSALDSRVQPFITEVDGARYTTFAFSILSLPSGLRIILRGVEGGIAYVNQATSSAITVGGTMPGVYYRFVSSGGTGPDYSSRWISANTTSPQDVSSSEYNNLSVSMYNGLISSTISSDITFNVFAPNIVVNTGRFTTLFVTVKTYAGQNMSFSRIDYN